MLLLPVVKGLHYYVDSSEVKCFTEELAIDTVIVGAYKVLLFDPKESKYTEQADAKMKITVFSEISKHNLVDTTASAQGKFRFTAADDGTHKICLTPYTGGWYTSNAKIYFDLQFGEVKENDKQEAEKMTDETAMNSILG
jgi:gas vesicle protein